ncbi:MAG: hypothetical protein HOF72_10430 [Planctomycetaceae bacterium]|jgi:hypothetical protein|nr:hypothetical protein [Planctomycetaceae bacterium]
MSEKMKHIVKRIVPVSLVIGSLQFLFTAVLPKQLDLEMDAGVMVVASMGFSMLNILVCVFLGLNLAAKLDAANSNESTDE